MMSKRIWGTGILGLATLAIVAVSSNPVVGDDQCYADDRPCGYAGQPAIIRAMIPQEYKGADFRPACRRHDACYIDQRGRKHCDEQFKKDLLCACENSRRPVMCRMKARTMARAVKLFGGKAYRASR